MEDEPGQDQFVTPQQPASFSQPAGFSPRQQPPQPPQPPQQPQQPQQSVPPQASFAQPSVQAVGQKSNVEATGCGIDSWLRVLTSWEGALRILEFVSCKIVMMFLFNWDWDCIVSRSLLCIDIHWVPLYDHRFLVLLSM